MLHTQAVEPNTFSLLKELLKLESLDDFYLAGGTALALKYGHRKSVDLDLFSVSKIDHLKIEQELSQEFGNEFNYERSNLSFAIFCYIHNIKVDLVYHPHPIIREHITTDEIRMFSDEDLAAMKINAILGRGVRKDFYDIAELLQHYSLSQLLQWHKEKFPTQMLLISIPSALCYFDDAEQSEEPVVLNSQTWDGVKTFIKNVVNAYLK